MAFWPWSLYSVGEEHLAREWNDLWHPSVFVSEGERLKASFLKKKKKKCLYHSRRYSSNPTHITMDYGKMKKIGDLLQPPPSILPTSVASMSVPTPFGTFPGHHSYQLSSHNYSSLISLLDLVTNPNWRNPHGYHHCTFCLTQERGQG